MKVSLCVTTYNRLAMTIRCVSKVLDDPRIDEVVIMDDCSELKAWNGLRLYFAKQPKVKLHRNKENIGMSRNKARAVELASNEMCILFDSDNIIGPDYIDAVNELRFTGAAIFMPSLAKPNFNYASFETGILWFGSVKKWMHKPMFDALFNTCNYVVPRSEYLEVYEHNPMMKGTDTAWFNYLWLKSGRSFYVVKAMHYEHTVHDGSEWKKHADYNMQKNAEIRELLKQL